MKSRVRGEASTQDRRVLTTADAARFLGVSPSRVRQLILSRRLAASRFGRDYAITDSAIRHFRAAPNPRRGRPKKGLRTK